MPPVSLKVQIKTLSRFRFCRKAESTAKAKEACKMKNKPLKRFVLLSLAVLTASSLCGCQNNAENISVKSSTAASAQAAESVGKNTTAAAARTATDGIETTEKEAKNAALSDSSVTAPKRGENTTAQQTEKETEKDTEKEPEKETEKETENVTSSVSAKTEVPTKSGTPASFTACSIGTSQLGTFRYWLYTPSDPTENMPLIVYLHGGTGKGSDLNLITAVDGFPQYLKNGRLGDVRAYVLIPQLPSTQKGWVNAASAISELIGKTADTYKTDRNNISLTGHSMGGTGTWSLACAFPNLFARIAPLSGSVRNTSDVIGKLKNIPIHAFVGSADTVVPPSSSQEVVAALKAAGAVAEITVFDGADHFSVPSLAFLDSDIDLIGWLIGG